MPKYFLTCGALILAAGLSDLAIAGAVPFQPTTGAGPEMEPYGVVVVTSRIGLECAPHG